MRLKVIASITDVHLVIYLHGGYWQFLRYSFVSPSKSRFKFLIQGFNVNAFCSRSKEESGFMAVPLIDKGVVVVAVGYDIAPKGRVFFLFLTALFLLFGAVPKESVRISTFNMCLFHFFFRQHGSDGVSSTQECCFCGTAVFPYQVTKFLFSSGHHSWLLTFIFLNSDPPPPPQAVYTCVATLQGLTWLQWSSPLTGPSTALLLRSKVKPIRWNYNKYGFNLIHSFSLNVLQVHSLSVAYMTSCPSCPPMSMSRWRWQSKFLLQCTWQFLQCNHTLC